MAPTDQFRSSSNSPQDPSRSPQSHLDVPASSTPVEMTSLPSTSVSQEARSTATESQFDAPSEAGAVQRTVDGPSRTAEATQAPIEEKTGTPTTTTAPTNLARLQSTAIGPSSDEPIPVPLETGPTLMITLLLINGARHPFKLDGKYFSKRNVEVQGNDPFNLSVYKLKELILREWREGWSPFIPTITLPQSALITPRRMGT